METVLAAWPAGGTTASLILSSIAVALSGIALWRQQLAERRARNMPLVVDIFQMLRDAFEDRRFVIEELSQYDPGQGISGLAPAVRDRVTHVCHLFDNIGMMVAHRLVSYDLVGGYAGEAVTRAWRAVAPFIDKERERRKGPYQEYFQYLARRAENEPAEIIRQRAMGGRNPPIPRDLPSAMDPIPTRTRPRPNEPHPSAAEGVELTSD